MTSKTAGHVSPLTSLLPDARFVDHHSAVVEAPPSQVWDALHRLRWRDLRLAAPLMLVRGLGMPVLRDAVFDTFTRRAGAVLAEDAPRSAVLVMVGRPWSAVPRHAQVSSLEEAVAFHEPGWLVYGMDFVLHPLPGGRTLVETRTRCRPTDARAERRFATYWRVIRRGSGLVRRDLLASLQPARAA